MDLTDCRRAIRLLLDERSPADAAAVYYAFYHSEDRSNLLISPPDAGPGEAVGYVALSRTGMDLFRPYVTLRLPINDMNASVDLIYSALPPGAAVILSGPSAYLPLLRALFDIHKEEHFRLYALDRSRFKPVINVMVTPAESHNGLPRFVVRSRASGADEVVASAGINWQSPQFADLAVQVDSGYRRRGWGRSVVAAMVQHLAGSQRTPLYAVSEHNTASMELARTVGFTDTGAQEVMLEATLKSPPSNSG